MTKSNWVRRQFLSAGSMALTAAGGAASAGDKCGVFVAADAGPFYPVKPTLFLTDLTAGPSAQRAVGQVLYVFGHITNKACKMQAGAEVLIWQADHSGQYDHPLANKDKGLDPNFKYFARVKTDEKGFYSFKTILPRWYQFQGLRRAAHIHFGIRLKGGREKLTEMYFAGADHEQRRTTDRVWKSRDQASRDDMIVQLEPATEFAHLGMDFEPNSLCCRYNVKVS